ncbi:molecular chaperone Tir [Labilibaculum sp. A4]|uniref:Molecular chaperone Tir n=1 Tax=Labilibaculum euxinus TaxID=2686357 RepID=A0A425Y2F1_9BACT|nr:YbjN domain-containing protein [Labilibaculum euxinus]MDQ1772610.1 YbjN domain-containing protein [Labilibaculum euxinus]MUP37634.1 molecular chaperone Tir [Labilibaculum euxinus]MVB06839.1 molecular chaperone Tir [Labilibaculum euxinus]MWN78381.1 molecular chaperone Tir [Labilibaculum euxinus]
MSTYYNKVKDYLLNLEFNIIKEDKTEELFVVENPEGGIANLIVDCEDPILIVEGVLFELTDDNPEIYKALLKKNREIIHGAFVLDGSGKKVLFRDTLQLENLDQNELEATLNSLEMLLSEYSEEIISYSKL